MKYSVSGFREMQRCELAWYIRYVLRREPRLEHDWGTFGASVHTALQSLDNGDIGLACEHLHASLAPYDAMRAQAMVVGYQDQWAGDPLVVLAHDVPVETAHYRGELDGLVADTSGDVWILERKTTSYAHYAGSAYMQRLTLDLQCQMYVIMAGEMGYAVRGVIYDVLGKPGIKPALATPAEKRKYTKAGAIYAGQREADERVDEYYLRCKEHTSYTRNRVVFSENDLDRAKRHLDESLLVRAEHIRATGPCANYAACLSDRGKCDYWPACDPSSDIDVLDEVLYQERECR